MLSIYNFYSNDLEIVLTIILVNIFALIIYNLIKNKGKLEIFILKMKVNLLNKDNWNSEDTKIKDNTKGAELDFILRLCNNKNNYNSIYDFNITKKKENITNNYLYLADTMKSTMGATSYEKLKVVNFLPFEVKEFHLKIKLEKDEIANIKKNTLYIRYKEHGKNKKIKINKYLSDKRKK